jgi:cholesterol transport system auxiliary component
MTANVRTSDRRAFLACGVSTLFLASCSDLIGPVDAAAQTYTLAPVFHPLSGIAKTGLALSIARFDAPEFLSTERIALRRGETADYYADSRWTDVAPVLLQNELVEAFEASGAIDAVAKSVEGIRADFVLQCELRTFEAVYPPGDGAPRAVVALSAHLLVARTRLLVASHLAQAESAASANSVAAAVAALDAASSAALEEIVAWTLRACSAHANAVARP